MDEANRPAARTPAILLLIGVGLMPLFYFLSSGPMLWLVVTTRMPAQVWNLTYWPLTFMRDMVPGFHELFQWYLGLWVW